MGNKFWVDEFRMVDIDTINTVLRNFLVVARSPGYLNKPEYSGLAERNMEVYASSCWYASHWSYALAKDYCGNMLNNKKKYFICGLPYQLAVKEGMQDIASIEDKMSESTFSAVKFQMENEALWFSDADGGLYGYSEISRTCRMDYPMLPAYLTSLLKDPKIMIQKKAPGHIRILSADIAVMSTTTGIKNSVKNPGNDRIRRDNDATAIFINDMSPTKSGKYVSNIVYTVNYEGAHTEDQALAIRQMFEEYDCDYIVIDSKGYGWGILDTLLRDQVDYTNGQIYPALSCCNDEEIAARSANPRDRRYIWAVKGNPQFNTECALGLREAFRQGTIRLLVQEYDCEEKLSEIKGWDKLSPAEQLNIKMPYINTSLLINELVNLEYEAKDNSIKIKEKPGMRKDRYSSLSYNIYLARDIERKNSLKAKHKQTTYSVQFRAPSIRGFNTRRG